VNLIFNLGSLFYFKTVTSSFPLGISFFTFQQIAFSYNIYKRQLTKQNLLDYFTFVGFFPQLIAGPIVEGGEIFPQLKGKRILDANNIAKGLFMFSIGLCKKNILSYYLYDLASDRYSIISTSSLFDSWSYLLAFALYMYFDFSAYSDMAIGIAKMFGIDLPQNFKSPFQSTNIAEFWRRWHITLGRWIKNYLYIPLGGSRVHFIRNYFNLLFVFLAVGVWHGVSANFVLFGLTHGFGVIIYKLWKKLDLFSLPVILSWFITFFLCVFARVFYSLNSIEKSLEYLKSLINFSNLSFGLSLFSIIILIISFLVTMLPINSDLMYRNFKQNKFNQIIIIIFLVIGILYGQKPLTFEYFRF